MRPAAAAAADGPPSNCVSLLAFCNGLGSVNEFASLKRQEDVLLDGLEGVAQVEVCDLSAEYHTGNTREVVVQPRPDTGVDDFPPPRSLGMLKCRTAFRFPAGPAGSNP